MPHVRCSGSSTTMSPQERSATSCSRCRRKSAHFGRVRRALSNPGRRAGSEAQEAVAIGRPTGNSQTEHDLMAARAYWKGYLRLSLVSCPIQLFPATSERKKIRFHQINKKTGHRIKYCKVDTETGDQVDAEDIVMGYEIGK